MMVSRLILVVSVILLSVYGCGGGGGNSSSSSYNGPFLLAAVPATGSQTDDVDTEIKATFSEPVQFNSFHVSVGGVKVDGVASGKGKKTLKFTPKHKLQHGAKYTVTITGVKGMSGAVNPRTGGIESWFFSINPPSFIYTTAAASGNDEGHYNSIVYTQTHGAVIAYYINDNQSIKMLTTMDGKIFDQHPYYFTDMDVDADDITLLADNSGYHLLYLHKFDGLMYVSNNDLGKDDDGITNKWTETKLDAGISSRTYASMTIDKSGNIHISYYDAANTALKYATYDKMNWKYEIVDSGLAVEDPGRYSSIGVDDNGVVHVSYYDYHAATNNGNLKYAARDTAGNWTINVIDSTGNVGMYSSLALHNGNVYITYGDSDHNYIKLSSNETSAWKSEVVAKNITSATYSRLVIQDNGVKHFSYFSNCGGDPSIDLCYGAIGLATSIGLVVDDSGIGNGEQSSLALDEDGQAHIVYYDIHDRDLKYARQIN